MRMNIFSVCVVCILTLCFIGCGKQNTIVPTAANNIVATVNGAVLTEDDLYLAMGDAHSAAQNPEIRARALEELVDEELLYQQGLGLGLDRDAKYRDTVTVMEMRLREFKRVEMARRVTTTRVSASVDITAEDARQYYEQNKKNISTDLRLLILRFSDESSAQETARSLRSGAPFVQTAAAVSGKTTNTTEPRDAGFLHWNQIPAEWEKALYTLGKGQVSDVLRSPRAGICIIKVVETRNNPDALFETMSASIMSRLRDQRVQEAYSRYIRDLRKNATIVQFGKGGKPLE